MRKIFNSIFIIILLSGTFLIPAKKAFAADPVGRCSIQRGEQIINIPGKITKAQCDAKATVAGDQASWVQDGTTTETVSAAKNSDNAGFWTGVDGIFATVLAWVSTLVLRIAALLTTIGGRLLNGAIYYTVVDMSNGYDSMLTPIREAWTVLRDLANMSFIFVLLYAAILTILGRGTNARQTIVTVVIVAILMNFSMFFTRIVIDISNVLALAFYDAIAPGAAEAGLGGPGISTVFMKYLNLTTLWKPSVASTLDTGGVAIIGVMGTILLVITAFVFFAVAIMFVIRYVMLILVIIFSPVYFVSKALPSGLKIGQYAEMWPKTLFGQAFFAPIYFLVTWVALRVMKGVSNTIIAANPDAALSNVIQTGAGGPLQTGAFMLFLNFAIVIILLVVSLMLAKQWASQGGTGVGTLIGKVGGMAGGVLGGGIGALGRTSLGRLGNMASNSAKLQDAAEKRAGATGALSRLALYASKKARDGSFDVRNATIPVGSLGADIVRGTAGRTGLGRWMGLNRAESPEWMRGLKVGELATGPLGVGKAGDKGFRAEQEAKDKRFDAIEKAETDERRKAVTQKDIKVGVKAENKSEDEMTPEEKAAKQTAIEAMEKAVSKASEKEIEAIIDSNHELLDSQKFANALSVKQLEAINKSDKFSDEEKGRLKTQRFREIYNAAKDGKLGDTGPMISKLKDAELEMIDPTLLENSEFVSKLLQSQVDAIRKSSRFTSTQQDKVGILRREPLLTALKSKPANDEETRERDAKVMKEIKKLSPKDIAGMSWVKLDQKDPKAPSILTHPSVLKTYSINTLKKMGETLTPENIQKIREAFAEEAKKPGADKNILDLNNWITTDKDGERFFS